LLFKKNISKNISLFTFCNFIRIICSLLITVPLTTYYLEVKDLSLVVLFTAMSSILLQPLQCGGSSVVNAYYFSKSDLFMKKLLFHLFCLPVILKITSILVIIFIYESLSLGEFLIVSEDFKTLILILISNTLIDSRIVLYQIFTNNLEILNYFTFLLIEILSTNFFIFYFLSEIPDCFGYALSLLISSFLIFITGIYFVRKKVSFNLDKRYLIIIFKKGLRLYPYELFLIITQKVDYLLLSKYVSPTSLAILQHAKSYPEKIEIFMKSFYQSLIVQFMNALANKNKNLMKSVFLYDTFWYILLFLGGLFTIMFIESIIKLLTHGKLIDSYLIVCILYISLYFRSNQQFYISILQYNKKIELFTISSSILSLIYLVVLLLYLWKFGLNLQAIVFLFLFFSLLKWIVLKYLSSKYHSFPFHKSVPFYLSLLSYMTILFYSKWSSLSLFFS